MTAETHIVVGSGPTGIACASALVEAGCSVILLDVGLNCDSDTTAVVSRLRRTDIAQWDANDQKRVSQVDRDPKRKFGLKLVYGSSFPYVSEEQSGLELDGVHCLQSWAEGGLSNVWGAAMLPYKANDLSDWPIAHDELKVHYGAIARLTRLAGARDSLEDDYPYFDYPSPATLPPASAQARWILNRLRENEAELRGQGLAFGRARLAVRSSSIENFSSGDGSCRGCQLCLTGCPDDAIYRAGHTLDELRKNARFRYVNGQRVLRCIQHGESSIIAICRDSTGKTVHFEASRIFIAAGAISTSKIALASLGRPQGEYRLQFHPYFLLPALTLARFSQIASERSYALAQLFLELDNAEVAGRGAHLQIYTYSPVFAERFERMGWPGALAARALLPRLVAIQGYLHSREADPIRVAFTSDANAENYRLKLTGAIGTPALKRMQTIRRFLWRNALNTGLLPVPFAMKPGNPGDGNHIGASFPMSRSPNSLETDVLGRFPGFDRMHLVDASILPSLPPHTLTFSAMANAHRIGSVAARLEQK